MRVTNVWKSLGLSIILPFSAANEYHGNFPGVFKLQYESGVLSDEVTTSKDKSTWANILNGLGEKSLLSPVLLESTCDSIGASVSCRIASEKTQLNFFFDSFSRTVSLEVRMPLVKLIDHDEIQETMIKLALEEFPRALKTRSNSSWLMTLVNQGDLDNDASLYGLILANSKVKDKRRLVKMGNVSIWSYQDDKVGFTKAMFINDTLRYITNDASVAHAEAFVHPAMISHNQPKRVLLVSDMPVAPLREITKYTTLEHVDIVGTSQEVLELMGNYFDLGSILDVKGINVTLVATDSVLSWAQTEVDRLGKFFEPPESFVPWVEDAYDYSNSSMAEMKKREDFLNNLCENEEIAYLNYEKGFDWERQIYCKDRYFSIPKGANKQVKSVSSLSYDVILVDIPVYAQESLTDPLLHKQLKTLLDEIHGDSILVTSFGGTPGLTQSASNQDLRRDEFIRELTLPNKKGGHAYRFLTVYDEALASPLNSAFIFAFQSDGGKAYDRFYRTNSATFDLDMVQRLVPNTGYGRPPTLLYDGPTHLKYQTPSRNWENWYCRTAPGKDLPGCAVFTNWIFDPARHHTNLERRVHPVKGRSLHTKEFIPKDHFVNFDDIIHSITIDETEWQALVKFVEDNPDAELYRQLRDFIVVYGFEARGFGITGWAVSASSYNTFTNHACTNEDITVTTADYFVSLGEDGNILQFSPPATRRPRLASYVTTARRDIHPDEEIQIVYRSFRSDIDEHPYFDMFLTSMCSSGVGLVPVSKNDLSLD